jgi:hypothetical protein
MKLLCHLPTTILLAVAVATAAAAGHDDNIIINDDPQIKNFPDLVNWFTSHGGTIDPRITLGYEPSNNINKSNIRGMIATEHIPPETVLIHTPASLMIRQPDDDQGVMDCWNGSGKMIQRIIDELELGTESKWDMYFKFDGSISHDNDEDGAGDDNGDKKEGHTRVPTQWNKEGQPGSRAITELQGLPPSGETHRHIDWYSSACNNSKDLTDVQLQAFMMFLTRAADLGMVPMYDLMNHHNGLINTRLAVDELGGLSVIASTHIQVNEPIYNTYARGGGESSVDVFDTYGFVEDYPQLWRWSDVDMVRLTEDDPNHAFQRYVSPNAKSVVLGNGNDGVDANGIGFEPNSHHYEVLVVSPTLAALHPTKALVNVLGNGRRSLSEWEVEIHNHHATLRQSFANAIHDSAQTILGELPTTIEEDETRILPNEQRLYEKVKKKGRVDQGKADTIQAITYRLAFKKALQLAVDIAESEKFYVDMEEL